MPLIKHAAFLIPRSTSQLVVVPLYEKPLLQLKYNTGVADRSMHVKELSEFPKDLPKTAAVVELNPEPEMERLAASYGVDTFRKAYPTDDLFTRAFEASQTVIFPDQANAVPDMTVAPEALISELLELRVPNLDRAKATKIVEAGYCAATLANQDAKAIAAVTGLSANLIRATIEASKSAVPTAGLRGAPSAPSELRATAMEAPAST